MNKDNFAMVIFGASGDLTKRKLMPALYSLYKAKRLTEDFKIVGVSRTDFDDAEYQKYILEQLHIFLKEDEREEVAMKKFVAHVHYVQLDPAQPDGYTSLRQRLETLTADSSLSNLLFYLSTPPSLYGVIPQHLKAAGLNTAGARIIVEKPFGYDLNSAQELNHIYANVFREEQIYRIDHFLGKETAQNLLAFRFANGIFEPLWNRNYIDYVEITAVENLGIENRGGFYDTAGALRDMVQNHLVQLVALTAMEPPSKFNADYFRNEVVKVYESLKPLKESDFKTNIVRGQYIAEGDRKGYREEKGIHPDSRTETFVAMKLEIDNWRWNGVPFYIRTGKQMPTKVTEIVIHFKAAPHQLFQDASHQSPLPNRLTLRIQPNEGMVFKIGMKVPGAGFDVKQVAMDFSYNELGNSPIMDAYARLIDDCIQGDPTLFTRSDAVEASWKFFDPILRHWQTNPSIPLYGYPAGTWGPQESEHLMTGERTWTNPCKNLANTELYCEL